MSTKFGRLNYLFCFVVPPSPPQFPILLSTHTTKGKRESPIVTSPQRQQQTCTHIRPCRHSDFWESSSAFPLHIHIQNALGVSSLVSTMTRWSRQECGYLLPDRRKARQIALATIDGSNKRSDIQWVFCICRPLFISYIIESALHSTTLADIFIIFNPYVCRYTHW